jgi:cytochrome P450
MSDIATLDNELMRLFSSAPDLVADPFPLFRLLREEHPVHDAGAFVLISRYGLIKDAFLDPEKLSSQTQRAGTSRVEAARAALDTDEHRRMFDYIVGIERTMLTFSDGAEHARLRDVAAKLFTPRRIAQLEDSTQELTDSLLDQLAAEGDVADFDAFASQLPALVIGNLLGVPAADAPLLIDWGAKIMANLFGGQGPTVLEEGYEGHRAFGDYIGTVMTRYRETGEAQAEAAEALLHAASIGLIGDEQLSAMFREMLLGGFETTRISLLGTVFELMRNRDQWRAVCADPSLATNAFEEGLRVFGSAQWSARIPLVDMELEGVHIPADKTCILMLGAANRDPAVFEDPDRFDIGRANVRQHLAFAVGKHYCLGQALARLEGRIALHALATRFPDAELAIPADEVRYAGNALFRRVAALPIRLGGDRRAS